MGASFFVPRAGGGGGLGGAGWGTHWFSCPSPASTTTGTLYSSSTGTDWFGAPTSFDGLGLAFANSETFPNATFTYGGTYPGDCDDGSTVTEVIDCCTGDTTVIAPTSYPSGSVVHLNNGTCRTIGVTRGKTGDDSPTNPTVIKTYDDCEDCQEDIGCCCEAPIDSDSVGTPSLYLQGSFGKGLTGCVATMDGGGSIDVEPTPHAFCGPCCNDALWGEDGGGTPTSGIAGSACYLDPPWNINWFAKDCVLTEQFNANFTALGAVTIIYKGTIPSGACSGTEITMTLQPISASVLADGSMAYDGNPGSGGVAIYNSDGTPNPSSASYTKTSTLVLNSPCM